MKIGDEYLIQTQHIAEVGTIKEIGENYLVLVDVEVYDLREVVSGTKRPLKGPPVLKVYLDKKLKNKITKSNSD